MRKVIKIIMLAGADILVAAAIIIGSYWYTYVKPYKLKSLAVTVTSSAADETTKVSQDWKTKFAEYFTADIISKKMSYSSPNIAVDIQKKEMGTGHNKVTYYVADIHIASINCLQTKFAWDTYGVGYYQSLKKMSGEVSAVMAINGDSYSNDRHSDSGTIIRNGVVYRMEDTIYDVCVLYSDGTMRTFAPNEFDANQAIKDGAYQTWIFGPALLDNNGKAKTSFNTWDYIRRSHPRSAIGYYEPGHYCMIVVDGRQSDENYSRGMYLGGLAKVFEDLGCKVAYNLDGGHCSFMTLNSTVVNHPYKPSKDISDCIYLAEP